MSTHNIALTFRGVEHLLITFFAGAAIYWGYRLFSLVLPAESEIAAGKGDFSLRLKRVGPGVVFALFGAIVLVVNLTNPMTFAPSNGGDPDDGSVVWMQTPNGEIAVNRDIASRRIRAINTILSLTEQKDSPAAKKAINELQLLRGSLIDVILGEGSYQKSVLLQDPKNQTPKSKEQEALISQVNQLKNENF